MIRHVGDVLSVQEWFNVQEDEEYVLRKYTNEAGGFARSELSGSAAPWRERAFHFHLRL